MREKGWKGQLLKITLKDVKKKYCFFMLIKMVNNRFLLNKVNKILPPKKNQLHKLPKLDYFLPITYSSSTRPLQISKII